MNSSDMGFEFESLSIGISKSVNTYVSQHPAANEVHGSVISSFHAPLRKERLKTHKLKKRGPNWAHAPVAFL
jgi:hypothetical protein